MTSRVTVIDFPFDTEGLTLSLIPAEEAMIPAGEAPKEYEIKLCDATGRVLQQFSCGKLKEPIQFSYDSLTYGNSPDLELFSSDSQSGLLFTWDGERFSEKAIIIPRYQEVRMRGFMSTSEDNNRLRKTIYQINEQKERTEQLRTFCMQKDTGTLKIWDCLEKQFLFKGNAELDQSGNLLNEKYYRSLFWSNLYLIWEQEEDTSVRTWISGENADNREYESREALLTDFGFEEKEPLFRYYDQFRNLQVELYLDADTGKGCGIRYVYGFSSNIDKTVTMHGFTFDDVTEQVWEKRAPFDLKTVSGVGAEEFGEDCKESFEYTEEGKLDSYSCEVPDTVERERVISTILAIDYIYRDDGTLSGREYHHDPARFGTTYSSVDSYYDEDGRIVLENSYSSHGGIEDYYIYENGADKPTYRLNLDGGLGYFIPRLEHFK